MRVVVVVLVVVLLAACAREATPRPTGSPVPVKPTVTELDAYESRIRGGNDADAGSRLREAEERIEACMSGAGFEYHPQIAEAQHVYVAPLVLTREHAERSGYGDTIAPAPGVTPSRWAHHVLDAPGEVANLAYRESLSAEELDAYWAVLGGEQLVGGGEHADGDPQDGTPDDGGCQGKAMAEVFADVMVPEPLREVEGAVRQVARAVENEAQVSAAVDRWSTCMAQAGYPDLTGRHGGAELVAARAADFPAPDRLTFAEIEDAFPTELAELQAFELEVALADVTCLEQTGFYPAWDEARTRLHGELVAAHRTELEAWATWAEELRVAGP